MSLVPLYCVVGVCVAIVVLWCIPRLRQHVDRLEKLVSLVASVAALTVFLQIYWSVEESRKEDLAARNVEATQFYARMTTLYSELVSNAQVADLIRNDQETHLNATTVPDNMFVFNSIEEVLRTGEIANHSLRNQIRNVYHRMLWANRCMENVVRLSYQQTLMDPEQPISTKRVSTVMGELMRKADEIGGMLNGLLPLLSYYIEHRGLFEAKEYQGMSLGQFRRVAGGGPTTN